MKSITIAGNIGKDAEVRRTTNGDEVASFSVAVEERAGGEKRTLWFDVSLWGVRGSRLAPYLTKGGKVAVSGELTTREHNGKTYLAVRADQVTLLGGKPHDDVENGARRRDPAGQAPRDALPDDMDSEIPF